MSTNGKDEIVDTKDGIKIIVGGTPYVIPLDELTAGDEISFEQVLALYGKTRIVPEGPYIEIEIDYVNTPENPPADSLDPGEIVKIKEGTVFYVTITDNS